MVEQAWRGPPSLRSAVLPQIRAFESKGKVAIVNPRRLDEEARKRKCSARFAVQPWAFPPRRGFDDATYGNLDYLVAAWLVPASLEKPQGLTAGPARC